MAMTVLGFGGVFAAITYIAPMMTHVAGFAAGSVTWLLVLFGLGMVVGNLVGGRYADRALMPMLYVSSAPWPSSWRCSRSPPTTVPAAVTIVLDRRPRLRHRAAAAEAGPGPGRRRPARSPRPSTSAPSTSATRCAWLGGLVIAAGFGYTAPNWVGAILAAAALALALVAAATIAAARIPGASA